MEIIRAKTGNGKYLIESVAVYCGNDLHVVIGGGEEYHTGAVSVAVPGHVHQQENKRTATASVICIQGHKEDDFAQYASKLLAKELDCVVTVGVGIHIDQASGQDLIILEKNFKQLIENLLEQILNHSQIDG